MSEQTVTIEISQALYDRLRRVAEVTHQPVAELVARAIDQSLPPLPDSLTPELHQALAGLETFSDKDLWTLARRQISDQERDRYTALIEQERSAPLDEAESAELANLYHQFNVHMLRKAYAWALLKWRGYALPSPNDLNMRN